MSHLKDKEAGYISIYSLTLLCHCVTNFQVFPALLWTRPYLPTAERGATITSFFHLCFLLASFLILRLCLNLKEASSTKIDDFGRDLKVVRRVRNREGHLIVAIGLGGSRWAD